MLGDHSEVVVSDFLLRSDRHDGIQSFGQLERTAEDDLNVSYAGRRAPCPETPEIKHAGGPRVTYVLSNPAWYGHSGNHTCTIKILSDTLS